MSSAAPQTEGTRGGFGRGRGGDRGRGRGRGRRGARKDEEKEVSSLAERRIVPRTDVRTYAVGPCHQGLSCPKAACYMKSDLEHPSTRNSSADVSLLIMQHGDSYRS